MILGKRPLLAHSLIAFEKCERIKEIFVVIPDGDNQYCRERIVDPLKPVKPVHLVTGGPTRQASVYNGLKAMDGRFDLVVIHDGVRPLIRPESITACVIGAERHGGCILATEATDTIKTVDEDNRVIVTMKRQLIRMAQTPQAFYYSLILGAHQAALKEAFVGTDDAQLVELCGEVVKVIPGDPHNIKITTKQDLNLAEALLSLR